MKACLSPYPTHFIDHTVQGIKGERSLSGESVLFRLRTAQAFDLGATMFALQPPFLGGQRGLRLFADFGPLGCLADQSQQAGNGVLAVLFLDAKPPGIDDQITFLG